MQCALWYMRHGTPRYDILDSEEEAADRAFSIIEGDLGAVSGIQFDNGLTIPAEEWPALKQRILGSFSSPNSYSQAAKIRATRCPFTNHPLSIRVDDENPEWLGIQK